YDPFLALQLHRTTVPATTQIYPLSLHDALPIYCATQTGISVMTVCGAPTLGIHLHEINASDTQKAKDLGYEDANNLINEEQGTGDRKSTRLNSSHVKISYAVFCSKKKNKHTDRG